MSYNTSIRFIQGGTILEVGEGGIIRFGTASDSPQMTFDGTSIVFENLPSVDPGTAGALWNNSGALAVSTGY